MMPPAGCGRKGEDAYRKAYRKSCFPLDLMK
jgi:hypothetical protein